MAGIAVGKKTTWLEAVFSGPGPQTAPEVLALFVKGIAMGCADLVPGVSGGTVALITGIYNKLLHAVSSVGDGLALMLRLRFKDGLAAVHIRFLVCLLLGIGSAIIGLAKVMHFLLEHYPVPTWGSFFGLISASIVLIGRQSQAWTSGLIFFICGGIAAYFIVGMIPVSTPETAWFIFLTGMVAICAMILPGISGAFLLLILGKYQYITAALKNPFLIENITVIFVFCGGCLTGLLGFSRFLSYMMDHHKKATMALMTGFMLGSMRKIWPWKETLESITIRGKVHILTTRNVFPAGVDMELITTLALAAAGFILVILLQKMAAQEG